VARVGVPVVDSNFLFTRGLPMRLGILADVHNEAEELRRALSALRIRGVDQVITLGDICDPFAPGEEMGSVASQLADCQAEGAWGNHDFVLCQDVPEVCPQRYPSAVFDWMAGMRPRMVLEDCHFSHRESSVDPYDIAQLWDLEEERECLSGRAEQAFAAVPQLWQFVEHYHRWWATTPAGPSVWAGDGLLRFQPDERYFVVVGPVCEGWCAILDTEQRSLEPLRSTPVR